MTEGNKDLQSYEYIFQLNVVLTNLPSNGWIWLQRKEKSGQIMNLDTHFHSIRNNGWSFTVP
jgi:hypothetical protein